MKRTALVFLILALPFLTGCFSTSSYFNAVKNDVVSIVKENFSEDVEFAIGPVTLSLAGWFISEEDDPVAAELIEDLSRLQVGVYKRNSNELNYSNYQLLRRIDKRMKKFGWEYIVRSCNGDEISAVYVNKNIDDGIKKMFVVSLDKEELVLVQLDGNLNRVMETAIKDRGLSYN